MSKNGEKMEMCKKHISSLLVSAGATPGTFGKMLTLQQLKSDYEDFIGERLPVRELGFNTPEQLFREMPDTIQLIHFRGELNVQGVSSGKTAHIEKMISRQKTAPKVPKAKRPGPGPSRGGRGGRYGGVGRGGYARPTIRRTPQPQTPLIQPVRTIPAMIRSTIRDLLLAFPQGVLLSNFNHAYAKRFNQQIAVEKLGFSSMYEFFSNMRDMVSIEAVSDYDARISMKAVAPVALKNYRAPVQYEHDQGGAPRSGNSQPPSYQPTKPPPQHQMPPYQPPAVRAVQNEPQTSVPAEPPHAQQFPHPRTTISQSQTSSRQMPPSQNIPSSQSSYPPSSQPKAQSWTPQNPTLQSYLTSSSQIPPSSQPLQSSSSVSQMRSSSQPLHSASSSASQIHQSSQPSHLSSSSRYPSSHGTSLSQTVPSSSHSSQTPHPSRPISQTQADNRLAPTQNTPASQTSYPPPTHSAGHQRTPDNRPAITPLDISRIGSPEPKYDCPSPTLKAEPGQGPTPSPSVAQDDDYRPFEGEEGMENLRKAVQLVLRKSPEGIRSINFAEVFMSIICEELPVQQLGHHSVIELMGSMLDIVYIERLGQKDWLLFDVRYKSAATADVPKSEKYSIKKTVPSSAPMLDVTFKERIRQVVQAYNGYIKMSDLSKCYYECMAEELPVRELGFSALEVLVRHLSSYIKMEMVNSVVMLTPVGPVCDPNFSLLRYRPHQQVIEKKHAATMPPDAIGSGVNYTTLVPPQSDTGMVEVYVGQIHSPSKFWLQLKGRNTTTALEELMDKMEFDVAVKPELKIIMKRHRVFGDRLSQYKRTFYYQSELSKAYRVPEFMLMIGQVCVAIYPEDENWHRVQITGFRQLDYVEVYFVDYGGHCTVHKDNLRLLRSQFFRLPRQALLARLAHIKPPQGERWSEAAGRHMLTMCDSRPLIAIITEIKPEIISVALCDTTGEQDVHINDVLCDEGLAVISPDGGPLYDEVEVDYDEVGTEDGSEETSSVCSSEPTLQDLRATLDTLNITRKRILQKLYKGIDTNDSSVEQLKVIEQQMSYTRQAIRDLDPETNAQTGAPQMSTQEKQASKSSGQQDASTSDSMASAGVKPIATVNATSSPKGKMTNTVAPMPISTTLTTASNQASALPTSMAGLPLNPTLSTNSLPTSQATVDSQQQMQQVILHYQLLLNHASLQASQQAQQLMLMNTRMPAAATATNAFNPSAAASGGGDANALTQAKNMASLPVGLNQLALTQLGLDGLSLNPAPLGVPVTTGPVATTAVPSVTTASTQAQPGNVGLSSAARGLALMPGLVPSSITANLGRGSSQINSKTQPGGLKKHSSATGKPSGR